MMDMDHDFESRLRSDLARAVLAAPELDEFEPAPVRRRLAIGWVAPVAAAAAVAVAAGAWWVTNTAGPSTDGGAASCPSIMRFDGRSYQANGDQVRIPRPGAALGTGVHPACGGEKRWESDVNSLSGVEPGIAVWSAQRLWVADDLRALPQQLAALERPVRCTGAEASTIAGDWQAVKGPMPTRDDQLTPPYAAVIRADEGDALPLRAYSAVVVDVEITSKTLGGRNAKLVEEALRGPTRVVLGVRCAGGRFVADSIAADN